MKPKEAFHHFSILYFAYYEKDNFKGAMTYITLASIVLLITGIVFIPFYNRVLEELYSTKLLLYKSLTDQP